MKRHYLIAKSDDEAREQAQQLAQKGSHLGLSVVTVRVKQPGEFVPVHGTTHIALIGAVPVAQAMSPLPAPVLAPAPVQIPQPPLIAPPTPVVPPSTPSGQSVLERLQAAAARSTPARSPALPKAAAAVPATATKKTKVAEEKHESPKEKKRGQESGARKKSR